MLGAGHTSVECDSEIFDVEKVQPLREGMMNEDIARERKICLAHL